MRITLWARLGGPAVLIVLCAALVVRAAATPPEQGAWHRVWSDEFDRDGAPDPRNWTFETGFVRNEELQWYQPQSASCRDGVLVIEARRYIPG
jgi:hypothetical protein